MSSMLRSGEYACIKKIYYLKMHPVNKMFLLSCLHLICVLHLYDCTINANDIGVCLETGSTTTTNTPNFCIYKRYTKICYAATTMYVFN